MNIVEFAMYRAARQRMSKEQAATAVELADKADEGDLQARQKLRRMVMEILFNHAKPKKGRA